MAVDTVARQWASRGGKDAWAASRQAGRVNPGNVGIRIFGGRIYNPKALASGAGSGRTYEVVMTTAVPFDAVRLVFAFGQTNAVNAITPSIYADVRSVGDLTDATIATDAGWTAVTFGGTNNVNGSNTLTAAPSASEFRRAITVSDIIPVASVARTDGGTYPIVVARAYIFTAGAAGNYVMLGNGVQDFSNWETHSSGRIWRMRGKGGQFVATTQSGMTRANSIAETGSPIIGVIYYARGKVVNVAGFGDSITEGQGTYIGEGFGLPACQALSVGASGVAYEWSDMGWSGTPLSSIRQHVIDAVATPGLKWDIGFLPGFSPNDITTTIAASDITQMRFKTSHTLSIMKDAGMVPILWTGLPSNTAVKNYGSTDSLRVALNADYRTWATRGQIVADFDSAIAGVTTGGQVQMLVGTTSDNIHPNDTGNALLSTISQSTVAQVTIPPVGRLVV